MFAWFCYCMSSWIVYLLWFQSHQDLPPPPIPRRVSLELFIYYFICFVCNVVSNISSSGTSFLKEPPYTTFIQLYNPTTLLQCYNRSTSLQPFYNSTLAVNISWISTPFLIKLPCHIIKLPCRTSRLAVLWDLPFKGWSYLHMCEFLFAFSSWKNRLFLCQILLLQFPDQDQWK